MTKDELRNKIQDYCDKNPYEPYIGYEGIESKDLIEMMREGEWDGLCDKLCDDFSGFDYITSYWEEVIANEFASEIKYLFGENFSPDDVRDEFYDIYIPVSVDVKRILKNTGGYEKRVVLFSNYDQMLSDYSECHGGYGCVENYFGDLLDALNINPQKMKKFLESKGAKTVGRWKNCPKREGSEIVSYEDLYNVMVNNCCGGCLTFVLKGSYLDDYEEWLSTENDQNKVRRIRIPSGTPFTIFNSFEGGGSVFEYTKKSFGVTLDEDKFPSWGIRTGEYSCRSVYGQDVYND